jgi:hypothetical protein
MQGKNFVESQRRALDRMFRYMDAWGMMWDINWEVAQEQSNSFDVHEQMLELERSSSKREMVSINSALRKNGFSQRFTFNEDNYYNG